MSNDTNRFADLARLTDRVQSNARNHSTSISCAYQLCSCSKARVMFRKPSSRVKMIRNGRSRLPAFWQ
eukprot:9280429-Pyramimonas_sp.AAC.1